MSKVRAPVAPARAGFVEATAQVWTLDPTSLGFRVCWIVVGVFPRYRMDRFGGVLAVRCD